MSKVGSVRANVEGSLSRDSISQGFILSNGLLGDVLKAVEELRIASVGWGTVKDQRAAWLNLFDALKEIEEVCGEGDDD